MLTPINLLNTESSLEMPTNAGRGEGGAEFQARLGEVMETPTPADQLDLTILYGDDLPLGGNHLPVDILAPTVDQPSPTLIDESNLNIDERGLDVDPSVFWNLPENGPMAPFQIRPGGRGGVPGELPLPTATVPIPDANSAATARDRLAEQLVDSETRVAAMNRLAPVETNENAKHIVGAAVGKFRLLAEKPDGTQKTAIGGVSQSALVVTENPASLQGPSLAARAAPAPPIVASIDIPVLDDAWGEALNERVLWMAGKSVQRAEIRLNPGDLGPIRIEVSIVDDTAKVTFNAQHALTREAIETAMPRLREMLGENGISLTDSDVADTDAQNDPHARENDQTHGPAGQVTGSAEGEATMATSLQSGSSSALVDTFV